MSLSDSISEPDSISERLEDQIAWYDRKSLSNQRYFKRIKVVEIAAAALIPFLSAFHLPRMMWVTGAVGVVITLLEGILHLNQFQQSWIAYRSTCESLKHEKYIYLAKAAPYAGSADPHALLAERIESLVSQEHAKWASVQQHGYSERTSVGRTDAREFGRAPARKGTSKNDLDTFEETHGEQLEAKHEPSSKDKARHSGVCPHSGWRVPSDRDTIRPHGGRVYC